MFGRQSLHCKFEFLGVVSRTCGLIQDCDDVHWLDSARRYEEGMHAWSRLEEGSVEQLVTSLLRALGGNEQFPCAFSRLDHVIRVLYSIEGLGVESLSLIRSRTRGDIAAAEVRRYLPRRPFFVVELVRGIQVSNGFIRLDI